MLRWSIAKVIETLSANRDDKGNPIPLTVHELATRMADNFREADAFTAEKNLTTVHESFEMVGTTPTFSIFPANSRARYGFPDADRVEKGKNPDAAVRKRYCKDADGKVIHKNGKPVEMEKADGQKQYWPLVVLGHVIPAAVGTGEAYDGRYEDIVHFLNNVLSRDDIAEEFALVLATLGLSESYTVRGVRGGVSVRLSEEGKSADDSQDIDISDIVSSPAIIVPPLNTTDTV